MRRGAEGGQGDGGRDGGGVLGWVGSEVEGVDGDLCRYAAQWPLQLSCSCIDNLGNMRIKIQSGRTITQVNSGALCLNRI